jgi:hypothetical protein
MTMDSKATKHFRLIVDVSDKAVARLRVKERSSDGKYLPIERPWGVKELAAFKLAAKAATLVSRGVADLDEVCRTVSAPRRHKVSKKRLAEDGALQSSRTGRRHNGSDKAIADNA